MYFYFHLFFHHKFHEKIKFEQTKIIIKIDTDIARYLQKNFLSKFCEIKQESIFSSRVLISLSSNAFTSYYMA